MPASTPSPRPELELPDDDEPEIPLNLQGWREDRPYWIAVAYMRGFGAKSVAKAVEAFGTLARAWTADEQSILEAIEGPPARAFLRGRRSLNPERLLRQLKQSNVVALTREDPRMPAGLLNVGRPILTLFVKGDVAALRRGNILGVVGTRKMTPYGRRAAESILAPICSPRLTLVSGMAIGVDGLAHEISLKGGATNVAVLGSGVDVPYPRRHAFLYERILASGAVISEFPPGTRAAPGHFPLRNRLIAGLADTVLVVEAGFRSGAMNTALHAVAMGKEVLAVPGDVFRPSYAGCLSLIRNNATVVRDADDLAMALSFGRVESPMESSLDSRPELEMRILARLETESATLDDIVTAVGAGVEEVSQAITYLELDGLIAAAGQGRFSRRF